MWRELKLSFGPRPFRPPLGLNLYDILLAGCLILSVLAVPVVYTQYLNTTSANTAESFRAQNLRELEAGEIMSLTSRLNSFSTSINWVCLSAENSGNVFFSRSKGDCGASFSKRRINISPSGNRNIRVDLTLKLPRVLEISFILILCFQMLSLALIYWGGKKAETLRHQKDIGMALLAAQVAHDIRSPLAALGAAAKRLELLPPEQRALIVGSVHRMQGIADDLLQRYRAPSAVSGEAKPSVCALSGFIEQIIAEKRLQHKDKPIVKIEFTGATADLKALVDPKELQRLISNLVNNSVEAFDGPGIVSVGLSASDSSVLIEVKDNGKGIPPEILAKLGRKGGTHGKAGGTGLGLYHARTTIESWGGSFSMKSKPGEGTAILISLPRATDQAGGRLAVLLDDDLLVHMNWKLAAKAAGVELKAYKTPADFTADIDALPKDTPIYIDSDLGAGIKGENIAIGLHAKGFTGLTMATGHGPEEFAHLPWLRVTGKEPPWGA